MALPTLPKGFAMGKRVFLFVLIAAIALAGVVGTFIWGRGYQAQVIRLSLKLEQTQQELDGLKAQHTSVTQRLDQLKAKRQDLDDTLAALREQLGMATTDLERTRISYEEIQSNLEELRAERAQLRADVARVTEERDIERSHKATLEQKVASLGLGTARLRERLALLNRDYSKIAEQLAELEYAPHAGVRVVSSVGPTTNTASGIAPPAVQGGLAAATVELPPIIVRRNSAGMSIPVRGRIVEVNTTHQFIVVDKGTMDGVRVGMNFDLVRGSSTVGRARVVRVRPHIAACNIVRARTPGPLQSGDAAVQAGP